jgi:hypothetical protein
MSASQKHYAVVSPSTPFVTNSEFDRPKLLHWDGAFFAVLCLVSWIWFACLWARLRLSKPAQGPPPLPPLKVENFVGSDHWRN